jgi:hypothetical protein
MFSQTCYVLRSRIDGSYVAAYPNRTDEQSERKPSDGYVLMFQEHFDALSYINKFASGMSDRFQVESLPGSQVAQILNRWGYKGVGVVKDPLLPTVDFLGKT